MSSTCLKISESVLFQRFVTVSILIAGAIVGVSTYADFYSEHEAVLELLNSIILGVFIIEIIIKILAKGRKPWLFFLDGWNVFDFLIVAAVFVPLGGGSIAVLRLFRLLRVLKLIRALPKLQMLVGALLKSIPSMAYVSILLLLLFYIYAVAGVLFFGENDPVHFADLPTSMLSLFRIVTLEDWTDIMYINMYGCANYGYDGNLDKCINSTGNVLGASMFFVSFVLIGTMIILNLFIGVIMSGMDEAKEEMIQLKRKEKQNGARKLDVLQDKMKELQELISDIKNNDVP